MAIVQAKLRPGLDIQPESAALDARLLVKDPLTGRFYRFSSAQGAVLRALDGTRDSSQVAQAATATGPEAVTAEQVESFLQNLRKLLLLDEPAVWVRLEIQRASKRRILGNLLSIKIRAFNPNRWLTRLEKKFRFCYSSGFVLFVWASIAAGYIISVTNSESLFLSIAELARLNSIPLLIVVALVIISIHEIAHGLTLKHFGGSVQEMGLLLLYFIPGFYCNVDDAWMLPKRERLWVTFAGGFIQLFLWAWATIAWRLLSPETFLSHVCLVAIAFSGIQTLFNFNPLIRLDGYYMLADFLEIPNLRSKAFAFLKRRLASLFLGIAGGPKQAPSTVRERRIYWLYGSAAFSFSAVLLAFMLTRVAGWVVAEFQMWGIVALMGWGLMAVQVPSSGSLVVKVQGGTLTSVLAILRRAPRLWVLLGLVTLGSIFPWELRISGDFTVRPQDRATVNTRVEGMLKTIHVDEGKRVRSGDVLAEMENVEIRRDLGETRGELATSLANLKLLKAGTRPEEIDKARKHVITRQAELQSSMKIQEERGLLQRTVTKKEAEFRNAGEIVSRSEKLFDQGLLPKNDLDRDRTNYEIKQGELHEARAELSVLEEKTQRTLEVKRKEIDESKSDLALLEAGPRQETIDAAEAEISKLVEKVKNLEQQVDYLKIRSPIDGVVSTPYLHNRLGSYLSRGEEFCEVVENARVFVDMPVPEKEIGDVRPGFPVTLKLRSYPKLTFHSKVESISPVATGSGVEGTVLVKCMVSNDSGVFKAGLTGVGKIDCGERLIGSLMTRRLTRWLRTEFWEYLP